MTWAAVQEARGGPFELRLVIEGWPDQFCTAGMTEGTTSDGRRRIAIMMRDGIALEERSNIAEGIPQASGFRVTLGDLDQPGTMSLATRSFTTKPSLSQWLDGSVAAGDVTFPVFASAPFSTSTYYHIGCETVLVTAKPTGTSLTVTRGQWDTTAKAHSSTPGEDLAYVELTDVPLQTAGRRCWLYAHGPAEVSVASAGTLLWRGVIAEDPQMDDTMTWSLLVDPLTAILDQEIGAELEEPLRLQGIYYSWRSPCVVDLVEYDSTSASGAVLNEGTVAIFGYFADNAAFVEELQSELDTLTAGWSNTIRVVDDGPNGWRIEYETDGATAKYLAVRNASPSPVDGAFAYGGSAVQAAVGLPVAVVDTSTLYEFAWERGGTIPGERGVPRATYARNEAVSAYWGSSAIYPVSRIFLDKAYLLTAGDVLVFTAADRDDPAIGRDVTAYVNAIDATTGQVDLLRSNGGSEFTLEGDFIGDLELHSEGPAPIKIWGTRILSTDGGPTDLADWQAAWIIESLTDVAAAIPFIASGDMTDWSAVVDLQAQGRNFLTMRNYVFRKPIKLRDFLEQELRLLGCYLRLDSTGRLDIQPIRLPAPTETESGDVTQIVALDQVVTNSFGRASSTVDGSYNIVEIKTGWDPVDEKHRGDTFRVREVRSISRLRKRRTLDIAPEVSVHGADISLVTEAREIADPVLNIFSERYWIVEVDVTLFHWPLLCGEAVRLTAPHLPHDGTRSLDAVGLVVGRRWDLERGYGTLSVLIHDMNLAGYAPAGRITAAAGAGTTWTVTLEASRYAPSGSADVDWFNVGDRIALKQQDTTSPTIRDGEITSISGNDVGVELDAAWAGLGGNTYDIEFDDAVDIVNSGNAAQLNFCFEADSGGRIADDLAAKVYAP